jgi:hypothetical protein
VRGRRGGLVSCGGGDSGACAAAIGGSAACSIFCLSCCPKKTAKAVCTIGVFTRRKRILRAIHFHEEKAEYFGTIFAKRRHKLIWCVSRAGLLGRMG